MLNAADRLDTRDLIGNRQYFVIHAARQSGKITLLDKPLVVFFDEADCLSEGTLITFLRQLKDGYINRKQASFIHYSQKSINT